LLASNYREDKDRNAMRVPGTCEWFLGHPKFLKWRKKKSASLLLVFADPGCGKSVLSRALVDEGLLSSDPRRPSSVCYFFFKDDDFNRQESEKALCAILHQMFTQKRALIKHAMRDFKDHGDVLRTSFSILWGILKKATADPEAGEIICVFDALDECESLTRKYLIEKLGNFHSVQNETNTRLKFLVTSRPYSDIERAFRSNTNDLPSISLRGDEESEKISNEINLVIEDRIPHISGTLEYQLKPEVQKAIVEHLKSMKHRTYLWLHLILDVIRDTLESTKGRLKTLIDKIPDSVDKAYEGILNRIRHQHRRDATKLLHIIVAAARPLTLQEMNVALAIKEKLEKGENCRSIDDLELDDEKPFQTKVRNLCGLFVSVIDSKIYLIHQTAKEFLVCKGIVKESNNVEPCLGSWKHSLKPEESNFVLAEICISYLLFTVFESESLIIEPTDEGNDIKTKVSRYTNQNVFLDYAGNHMGVHFRGAGIQDRPLLESTIDVCDTQTKRFLTWF
jgi:hypothetical protein